VPPDAAGIDVGGDAPVVAVPSDRDAEGVRPFGVFTAALRWRADWLQQCGVTPGVLESTGVYGMSRGAVLDAHGVAVRVVAPRTRARTLKKKTDVCDAAWWQARHRFGLLPSCFRPEHEGRALRTWWRHRAQLVTEAATLLQMMQKVLVPRNVSLHRAVADRAGATGRRLLRALCQGHRDPQARAALRDPNCQKSKEAIAKALEGTWEAAHLFEPKHLRKAWDFDPHQRHVCDKAYQKAAGQMPDPSQGRPLPEPAKRPHKHRHAPTAFDSDALLFPRNRGASHGRGRPGRQHGADGLVGDRPGPGGDVRDGEARRCLDDAGATPASIRPAHPLPRADGAPGGQGVSVGGAGPGEQPERAGQLAAPAAGASRHRHGYPGDGVPGGEAV